MPPVASEKNIDPVLVHARRESLLALFFYAFLAICSLTVCWLLGYQRPANEPVATVLGMPRWVFWGVLVPWLVANLFTFWFCFYYMVDDNLDDTVENLGSSRSKSGDQEDSW